MRFCQNRGKIGYATAREAAKAMRGTGHSGLNVFLCPDCRTFHLGRGRGVHRERQEKSFDWRKLDPNSLGL